MEIYDGVVYLNGEGSKFKHVDRSEDRICHHGKVRKVAYWEMMGNFCYPVLKLDNKIVKATYEDEWGGPDFNGKCACHKMAMVIGINER